MCALNALRVISNLSKIHRNHENCQNKILLRIFSHKHIFSQIMDAEHPKRFERVFGGVKILQQTKSTIKKVSMGTQQNHLYKNFVCRRIISCCGGNLRYSQITIQLKNNTTWLQSHVDEFLSTIKQPEVSRSGCTGQEEDS